MKTLPSIQIGDARMRAIDRIFAEIITEETADLLDRLAGYAEMASSCAYGNWNSADEILEKDEEAAYALAAKIRELLKVGTNE